MKIRVTNAIIFAVLMWLMTPHLAKAQEKQPHISIKEGLEEGKKTLMATVTQDGKPLEGVKVSLFVERTFGLLLLGRDVTVEDGTAAVLFPEGLPGSSTGELAIIAEINEPAKYAGVRGRTLVLGGVAVSHKEEPFPKALWAPSAPLALMVVIAVLLSAVWSTYAFVLYQLFKIRKGGKEL